MKKLLSFLFVVLFPFCFCQNAEAWLWKGREAKPKGKVARAKKRLGKIIKSNATEKPSGRTVSVDTKNSAERFGVTIGEDTFLSFSGNVKEEYIRQENPVMLNNNLPDSYGFLKTTIDLGANFDYGMKKYGYKAIEGKLGIRHKSVWGEPGKAGETSSEKITLLASHRLEAGEHSHSGTKPFVWVKEAWLGAKLNPIFGISNSADLHSIKAGAFPFSLGRGIALGSGYGTKKKFLAVNTKVNDFYAPGILVRGSFLDKKLSYDFYYALFNGYSSDIEQTLNPVKVNQPGNKTNPWAGCNNDNELWAARLKYSADQVNIGAVEFEPYIFFNRAPYCKLEFEGDSKSELGMIGFATEIKRGNLEIGAEIAGNFGQETIFELDRNKSGLAMGRSWANNTEDGKLCVLYDNIQRDYGALVPAALGDGWQSAFVNDALDAHLRTNPELRNTTGFTIAAPNDHRSKATRHRPKYKNSYRGCMGVIDASYHFPSKDLTTSLAYGYASGDKNPHIDERDKTYSGFVGLNELYNGSRVKSLIMLGSRVTRRPLTFDRRSGAMNFRPSDTANSGDDMSFTDMHYLGCGLKWMPKRFKEKGFCVSPNALLFWKDKESPKLVRNDDNVLVASDTLLARRFLGTEFNVSAIFSPLKNMSCTLSLATFIPGGYYKDIKGAKLKGDLAELLGITDAEAENYRIGTSNIYALNFVAEYKF